MGRLFIEGEMLSDPGMVSGTNEDAVAFVIPPGAVPALVAVVADGMGGQEAGEVASRMAVEVVMRSVADPTMPMTMPMTIPAPHALARSLAAANAAIRARRETDPACAGMGTTCTILLVQDNALFLGHIGDSRAYLLRSGLLQQLSDDHSAVRELVRNGQLTEAEARHSPVRNIILRALGLKPDIAPLIWDAGLPLLDGDILIMCSDGLTDGVDDAVIAATVSRLQPGDACRSLIDAAMQAGGHDNISVGVFAVRAHPSGEPDLDATRRIDPIRPTE